jgi:hypothetical protein
VFCGIAKVTQSWCWFIRNGVITGFQWMVHCWVLGHIIWSKRKALVAFNKDVSAFFKNLNGNISTQVFKLPLGSREFIITLNFVSHVHRLLLLVVVGMSELPSFNVDTYIIVVVVLCYIL